MVLNEMIASIIDDLLIALLVVGRYIMYDWGTVIRFYRVGP